MEREALKLAIIALGCIEYGPFGINDGPSEDTTELAITAIKEALAQPAQEPDALTIAYQSGYYDGKKAALAQPAQKPYAFDWLPEGATHLGRLTVNEQYGGVLEMRTHAFKYEGGVLMVYRTDNDNEYPEWIDATKVFVHTNFQVFPIAPPQPAQEPVTTVTSETRNPNVTMSWWHEPALPVGTKLYADPPQREWVGLTIYEMEEAFDESMKVRPKDASNAETIRLFATAIEAKLKEKNT